MTKTITFLLLLSIVVTVCCAGDPKDSKDPKIQVNVQVLQGQEKERPKNHDHDDNDHDDDEKKKRVDSKHDEGHDKREIRKDVARTADEEIGTGIEEFIQTLKTDPNVSKNEVSLTINKTATG